MCLDSLDTVNGKTKSMIDLLANLGISGSALLVTQNSDSGVIQAAHNLKKVWTLPVNQLNAQELLARETLIITQAAVRWAEESLASDPHGRLARSGASRGPGPQTAESPEASPAVEPEPALEEPAEGEPPVDQNIDQMVDQTEESQAPEAAADGPGQGDEA